MKVSELMEELSKYSGEAEISVFTEGNLYPCLAVQEYEGFVEIGCGWATIEYIEKFKEKFGE